MKALWVAIAVIGSFEARAAEPSYCAERPTAGPSASLGWPSRGRLAGGAPLEEGAALRIVSPRVRARCVRFGVPRLVTALEAAGGRVAALHAGSPPLSVGDLSRAGGGPIPAFSHSHQCGRDADLAFYQTDRAGTPVPAEDLTRFGPDGRALRAPLRFDVARNWSLVAALLSDPGIDVRWLFISNGLRRLLLAHAREIHADPGLIERAARVLHQPSDAPPHDDHLHLRIRCTEEELARGCRG